MAGFSALRAGAGLSTVATPKSVLATVAGFHPELMTEPLAETGEGAIGMRALESSLRSPNERPSSRLVQAFPETRNLPSGAVFP